MRLLGACCGAAVRCRAALDVGVEAVFMGTAPAYRLEKTAQAGKTAAVRGGGVERLLEEVRREFSGLPVYVGVEDGYVKRTAPMDKRQFRRYLETCKRLGFRFEWIRGRGGGFMWRLGLCVSKSGRNGWAWPRWLVLSVRRLCVFWGFLALVGFGL